MLKSMGNYTKFNIGHMHELSIRPYTFPAEIYRRSHHYWCILMDYIYRILLDLRGLYLHEIYSKYRFNCAFDSRKALQLT